MLRWALLPVVGIPPEPPHSYHTIDVTEVAGVPYVTRNLERMMTDPRKAVETERGKREKWQQLRLRLEKWKADG